MLVHGKLSQECCNFLLAHVSRVALFMKKNKPFDPLKVRTLGAQAIVPDAQRVTDLVEQTGIFHSASLRWS